MVHLKKIRVPANMNVVMGSIEELKEKRNHLQSIHTQTILKPRVRLRKVIFRSDNLSRRPLDIHAESEVNVEDYQITAHGDIIDGSTGKIYKQNNQNGNGQNGNGQSDNKQNYTAPPIPAKDNEDSFDHFGRYVASLLRSMEPQDTILLQAEIVNMIADAHSSTFQAE